MSYNGKFSNGASSGRRRKSRGLTGKLVILVLALALLSGAVLGTLAYLFQGTDEIVNTFIPGKVPNTPVEEFDGTTKTSIVIQNDGNVSAYIRVRLVTYRVDGAGNHIGGEAAIPDFSLGTDWFEQDGFYYYKNSVPAGKSTENMIGTNGITMKQYDDADGGKQVIEVISESIQSDPTTTVTNAWGVKVDEKGKLTQNSDANAGGIGE